MTPAGQVAAGLLVVVGANVVFAGLARGVAHVALASAELEEPPPIAVAALTVGAMLLLTTAIATLTEDRR